MTRYEVSVENRVFEIKFTTDKQEAAAKIRDMCKVEAEKDRPIPKPIPCPFCGYDKAVSYDVSLERPSTYLGIIGCSDCHATISHRFDISYGKYDACITLVKMWNTRAKK